MRKLEKRKNELPYHRLYSHYDSAFDWVPVEIPRFLGWESELYFDETVGKDAGKLKQLMTLLKLDRKIFFKEQSTVKLVRKANKNYEKIRSLYAEQQRTDTRFKGHLHSIPGGIVDLYNVKVNEDFYKKLDPELRKFFVKKLVPVPATAWNDSSTHIRFELGSGWPWTQKGFPFDKVKVRLTKAYSTHVGIPKSKEISERVQIEEKFDQNLYYVKAYGKGRGSNYWEKYEMRAKRKHWHSVLKVAVNEVPKCWSIYEVEDPGIVEEVIDQLSSKKSKGKY